MKRFLIFALAVTALSFPAATSAAKPTDPVKGPPCGDISLAPDYTFDSSTSASATTHLVITTAAPSCKKGSYFIYVYDAAGTNELYSCSYAGDGSTSQFEPCEYTSQTGESLCVYATSQAEDGHIMDVAPNEGCSSFGEPVVPGPAGATGFH